MAVIPNTFGNVPQNANVGDTAYGVPIGTANWQFLGRGQSKYLGDPTKQAQIQKAFGVSADKAVGSITNGGSGRQTALSQGAIPSGFITLSPSRTYSFVQTHVPNLTWDQFVDNAAPIMKALTPQATLVPGYGWAVPSDIGYAINTYGNVDHSGGVGGALMKILFGIAGGLAGAGLAGDLATAAGVTGANAGTLAAIGEGVGSGLLSGGSTGDPSKALEGAVTGAVTGGVNAINPIVNNIGNSVTDAIGPVAGSTAEGAIKGLTSGVVQGAKTGDFDNLLESVVTGAATGAGGQILNDLSSGVGDGMLTDEQGNTPDSVRSAYDANATLNGSMTPAGIQQTDLLGQPVDTVQQTSLPTDMFGNPVYPTINVDAGTLSYDGGATPTLPNGAPAFDLSGGATVEDTIPVDPTADDPSGPEHEFTATEAAIQAVEKYAPAAKKVFEAYKAATGNDVKVQPFQPEGQREGESDADFDTRITDEVIDYVDVKDLNGLGIDTSGLDAKAIKDLGIEPGTPQYRSYILDQLDKLISDLAGVDASVLLEGESVGDLQNILRDMSAQEVQALQRALFARGALNDMSYATSGYDPLTDQEYEFGDLVSGPGSASRRASDVGFGAFTDTLRNAGSGDEVRRLIEERRALGRGADLFGLKERGRKRREREGMLSLLASDDKRRKGYFGPEFWSLFDENPGLLNLIARGR